MSLSGMQGGAMPKTPDCEDPDDLPNQISAAYEVPQFPIEQIEKKLMLQRHLTAKWVKLLSLFWMHAKRRNICWCCAKVSPSIALYFELFFNKTVKRWARRQSHFSLVALSCGLSINRPRRAIKFLCISFSALPFDLKLLSGWVSIECDLLIKWVMWMWTKA